MYLYSIYMDKSIIESIYVHGNHKLNNNCNHIMIVYIN